jgi:3-carboxy-cis,cis-muconate cycloisomerase
VIEAFAGALGLRVPELPWHTHRDRIVNFAAALGITCGALGKVGRDLTLLGQTEVGEAYETPSEGRGGSSSMPHKQNPIRAITAVTVAIRAPGLVATMLAAMPQEHERAAGGWQAEWETLPELVRLTQQSSAAIALALANLTVDPDRIRANLDARGGVAMAESLAIALSWHVPRSEAMQVVERLCRTAEREERRLADVAGADAEIRRWLSEADIDRVLGPENYVGAAAVFIERTLQRWQV